MTLKRWTAFSTALAMMVAPIGVMADNQCGDQLAGLRATQWRNTTIPVCWENMPLQFARERDMTRQAVADTYEKNSLVRFTGWGQCVSGASGIRIQIEDGSDAPRTYGLGSQLDGRVGGMRLNFTFSDWSTSCKYTRDYCIRVIAVHEFGHALGFTHEQNRPEAPGWCRSDVQGTNPDTLLTVYDPNSVMNYCNPRWSNDGILSPKDIEGLQAWYGKPGQPTGRYDGLWTMTLSYTDPTCQSDQLEVRIKDNAMSGQVRTPQGLTVPVNAKIDAESVIQGLAFDFSKADHVRVTGLFPRALVSSSDCGCGTTRFVRKGD